MTEVYWKEHYSIGVEEIDQQHKKLFELMYDLQASLIHSVSDSVMGQALKELVEHTKMHFGDEEKLMKQIEYEDYDNHRQIHEKLISKLKNILLNLREGNEVTATDLIEFIKNWLIEHIFNEDIKVGIVIKERINNNQKDYILRKLVKK